MALSIYSNLNSLQVNSLIITSGASESLPTRLPKKKTCYVIIFSKLDYKYAFALPSLKYIYIYIYKI